MTQLVLLPPDSTGRQYPAEITVLQGNKHSVLADTVEDRLHSSQEVVREQASLSSTSSQKVYKQSFPLWGWGVVIGMALLFFFMEIRKR